MTKKIAILVVILIIIVGVGLLYYLGQRKEKEETSQASPEEQEEEEPSSEEEELSESLPGEIEIPEEIQAQIEEQGEVISITADGFEPREITLTQGEAISWVNYDSEIHQLTSESIFNVEEMKPGDIWTFPCDEKGVFSYQIVGYPEQGKIIVE